MSIKSVDVFSKNQVKVKECKKISNEPYVVDWANTTCAVCPHNLFNGCTDTYGGCMGSNTGLPVFDENERGEDKEETKPPSRFDNPLKKGYSFKYRKDKKNDSILPLLMECTEVGTPGKEVYNLVYYSALNFIKLEEINERYNEISANDRWKDLLAFAKVIDNCDILSSVSSAIMVELGSDIGLNAERMTRLWNGEEMSYDCDQSYYPLQPFLDLHRMGFLVTYEEENRVYRVHPLGDLLTVVYEGTYWNMLEDCGKLSAE